jgi:hypothetical protein
MAPDIFGHCRVIKLDGNYRNTDQWPKVIDRSVGDCTSWAMILVRRCWGAIRSAATLFGDRTR